MKTTLLLLLLASCPVVLRCGAEQIALDGVLGNSGEAGETLVRFSESSPIGAGVAVDRLGFLWASGGRGQINRYAADGRLIATYKTPAPTDIPTSLATVSDHIVLLTSGKLSAVTVDAAPGSFFKALNCDAGLMSKGSFQGKLALWKAGQLSLYDVATGKVTPFAQVAKAASIELGPDGAIYVESPERFTARAMQPRGQVFKFNLNGQAAEGWPKDLKGEMPILVGGYFFTFAGHGTINRLNMSFESAPGPVTGGSSGSFLGKLAVDPDLETGSGIANLYGDTYAVAAANGCILLASWNEERGELKIERRLGALSQCAGLGINKGGDVVAAGGVWDVKSKPDSPLRLGTSFDAGGFKQPCEASDGSIVAPCINGGRAGFVSFDFLTEPKFWEAKEDPFTKNAVGAVIMSRAGKDVICVVEPDGISHAYRIGLGGRFQVATERIPLRPTIPIKQLTAIASDGVAKLFVAADGSVVEFEYQSGNFVELRRWKTWGGDSLGSRIYLSVDKNDLWISDSEKNRVLCFDRSKFELKAIYGVDPARPLSKPGVIAAKNGQAAVYDSGNQRILRLKLEQ